jgi:glucose-6-phosphate isomerase
MHTDSTIASTVEWERLKAHVAEINATHLRDLMKDADRCKSLIFEANDITLDISRERVTRGTMELLFELAGAANLESKKAAMASGAHINSTENRAVMHAALRAPRGVSFVVDGADVVPEVHAVLDQIAAFSEDIRSGRKVIA